MVLGAAVIAAFLSLLPSAVWAAACISLDECEIEGGFLSDGFCVFVGPGGGVTNVPLCHGGVFEFLEPMLGPFEADFWTHFMDFLDPMGWFDLSDPFVDGTSIRDRGPAVSSASGTIAGQIGSSRTTDIGAGVTGGYNRFGQTFNLASNQTLVVGGMFRYDSFNTSFNAANGLPGFLDIGNVRQHNYSFAGMARYVVDNGYLAVGVNGLTGGGKLTDAVSGATGEFNTHGWMTGLAAGKSFYLYDTRRPQSRPIITKGPPPTQTLGGGYAVRLDLGGHLGYATETAGGFADTSGFIRGDEKLHFWDAGGHAQLAWIIPNNGWTWMPYGALTLDQQFGFSHTLGIPVQAGQGADTLYFGNAQTFWGGQLGISAQNNSGWTLGIKGYTQQSAEFEIWGGQAYVRYAFLPH
jgi:hypothetical protein